MTRNLNLFRPVSFWAVLALGFMIASGPNGHADNATVQGLFTSRDYKFVCHALIGGQTEVTLSQVALQKAVNPAVKDFAQRMVMDHQKANEELTKLATSKGGILPEAVTKKSEKLAEHLQNLSGAEFDRAYMKDMVGDHKQVVKMFQKAVEQTDDGDLKAWTAATLPTLAEHLRMAESVEGSLNGTKVAAK